MMSLGGRKCHFDTVFDNTSSPREVTFIFNSVAYLRLRQRLSSRSGSPSRTRTLSSLKGRPATRGKTENKTTYVELSMGRKLCVMYSSLKN